MREWMELDMTREREGREIEGRKRAPIIFSTTIDYSYNKIIIFSLKVCQLYIREVRGGEVQGHWGGNSWSGGIGLGGLEGGGSSGWEKKGPEPHLP